MKRDIHAKQSFLTHLDDTLVDRGRLDSSDLPISLLRQAARRLQIVTFLVISITLVSWIGSNWIEGELGDEFRSPADWIPPSTGLIVSLVVYAIARSKRLSPLTIINFGLFYEVGVSFFMAYGQYWDAFHDLPGERLTSDLVGISAVGLWMAFFTVIVPAPPRRALIALLLSGSAVPVTIALFIQQGNAPAVPLMDFLLIFVLPYLITIGMCLVAANIIYGLGKDVRHAQQLGSYQLLDLIGQGGMGEVWKARHNLLARPAAIKLIRPDALGANPLMQQEIVARFEQEAQATAGLESPHTVDLYDFGISDDGSLFYVMELLEGIDLDTLVRKFGPQSPERTVHILSQVCSSLSEAHQRGLIHRDIKPANILLCHHALKHDFVKVLDFGLVKRFSAIEGEDTGGAVLTRAEMVAGTPAFLAPEVATGKGTIDGRADLYSLGCVAFWLLTGRPVFEEETPVAMIVAHTSTIPVAAGEHSEFPVARELDQLILSCLEKVPEARPTSAEEMAGRLDAIPLESPWTEARAREWWSSHRPVGAAHAGIPS